MSEAAKESEAAKVRRPYWVEVHLTVRVPVIATGPREAEALGEAHLEEEVESGYGVGSYIDYSNASVVGADGAEAKENGSLPWGLDNDDERRDWTIKQWVEDGSGEA